MSCYDINLSSVFLIRSIASQLSCGYDLHLPVFDILAKERAPKRLIGSYAESVSVKSIISQFNSINYG